MTNPLLQTLSLLLLCGSAAPVARAVATVDGTETQITDRTVKRTLEQLDHEIRLRDTYKLQREARIDSVKILRNGDAPDSQAWFRRTMEIAKGYNSFDNDSALVYYTQGLEHASDLHMDSVATDFKINRATYLSISGYIQDALSEIAEVDTIGMSNSQKLNYYNATRKLYNYIANYYEGFLSSSDTWNNLAIEAQGKMLPLLDQSSPDYRLNLGEYLYGTRQYARANKVLRQLLSTMTPDTPGYAIASNKLASLANIRGNIPERIYYLALSAIADTRQGNMEVTSIQELGGLLFEKGDTERAHRYLLTAMNNVVESRASVRLSETSQLLTVIENDHTQQITRYRRLVAISMVFLVVCLFGLIVAIWLLHRQVRRLDRMKMHLEETNRAKDVYMSRFLTLCSIYMDKLKQLCKIVDRKLSAGQTEELLKLVRSPRFMEEQSREFYSVFDDAFLHIFPRFVEQVNALLRPDAQITVGEGDQLNPDLRILAFIRLGIDDATRLSQVLNYSVNTIYAYRNKLRNRAINRSTFEADVMSISAS